MPKSGPPNPIPLAKAAKQTVGSPGRSGASRISEVAFGVFIPLIVPAIVLAIFRLDAKTSLWSTLKVSEVSFGFGSVAIASIVRGLSMRGRSEWDPLIYVAVVILVLQTCIGLASDTTHESDRLVGSVQDYLQPTAPTLDKPVKSYSRQDWQSIGREILNQGQAVEDGGGIATFWILSLVLGLFMVIAATAFILLVPSYA